MQFESLQNQGKKKINVLYNPLITGLVLAEPPIASFTLNGQHALRAFQDCKILYFSIALYHTTVSYNKKEH